MQETLCSTKFNEGMKHKDKMKEMAKMWNAKKPLQKRSGDKHTKTMTVEIEDDTVAEHVAEPADDTVAAHVAEPADDSVAELAASGAASLPSAPSSYGCTKCRHGASGCLRCNPVKKEKHRLKKAAKKAAKKKPAKEAAKKKATKKAAKN